MFWYFLLVGIFFFLVIQNEARDNFREKFTKAVAVIIILAISYNYIFSKYEKKPVLADGKYNIFYKGMVDSQTKKQWALIQDNSGDRPHIVEIDSELFGQNNNSLVIAKGRIYPVAFPR